MNNYRVLIVILSMTQFSFAMQDKKKLDRSLLGAVIVYDVKDVASTNDNPEDAYHYRAAKNAYSFDSKNPDLKMGYVHEEQLPFLDEIFYVARLLPMNQHGICRLKVGCSVRKATSEELQLALVALRKGLVKFDWVGCYATPELYLYKYAGMPVSAEEVESAKVAAKKRFDENAWNSELDKKRFHEHVEQYLAK